MWKTCRDLVTVFLLAGELGALPHHLVGGHVQLQQPQGDHTPCTRGQASGRQGQAFGTEDVKAV